MMLKVCTAMLLVFINSSLVSGYEITRIFGNDGNKTIAYGINNLNQVVGAAYDENDVRRPFIWVEQNGMQLISTDSGYATDINDSGQVALRLYTTTEAYRWSESDGFELLNPETDKYSCTYTIGSDGAIVGYTANVNPIFWSTPTSYVNYVRPGGQHATMSGYNSVSGYTVGFAYSYNGQYTDKKPICWTSSTTAQYMVPLVSGRFSVADKINSLDQIVGYGNDSSDIRHALFWENYSATPIDLGVGTALGISNDGTKIVGTLDGAATVWIKENSVWNAYDLNDYLAPDSEWELVSAVEINDSNMIVGSGWYNGLAESFIFDFNPSDAIPEPATFISCFMGIVSLISLRRRKRK